MYFVETNKGFVLNKTNVKEIINYVGSDDTDDWRGYKVTLYTEHIKAFGKMHHAIRVKNVFKPTAEEMQDALEQAEKDVSDFNEMAFGE